MTFYPTQRAIALSAAFSGVALFIAAAAPSLWLAGFFSVLVLVFLFATDFILSPKPAALKITCEAPKSVFIGRDTEVSFVVSIPSHPQAEIDATLETNEILGPGEALKNYGFRLKPDQRGQGKIEKLWLKWRGPLGLLWIQHVHQLDIEVPVVADTKTVEEEAIRLFVRHDLFGAKAQIVKGEGSEFDSLREFQAGMDTRSIDWKQTARHRLLLSKEFRAEKNHTIFFAIDTGRLMCEPVKGGIARLDQALNASLLMAFVSLKLGDRVGYFGFDSEPHLRTGVVSGAQSFHLLRHQTAQLEYRSRETNYTLALSSLASHLDRRTLIVVFTDFTDTIGAELMLKNIQPLLKKHLVIFATFRDAELEGFTDQSPRNSNDITKAVIADNLLKEREVVMSTLQKMGVLSIEAASDRLGIDLLNQYLKVKQRNLL